MTIQYVVCNAQYCTVKEYSPIQMYSTCNVTKYECRPPERPLAVRSGAGARGEPATQLHGRPAARG